MKDEEELVYTTGETALLNRLMLASRKPPYKDPENIYLSDLTYTLKKICQGYKSLSEVYLNVITKNGSPIYKGMHEPTIENPLQKEIHKSVIKTLFYEKLDKMPLLINIPVLGVIAYFRLQLGK
jgi:hypothetical protein